MVKYIKDGAYTIVVDEGSSTTSISADDHNIYGDESTASEINKKSSNNENPIIDIDYTDKNFILKNLKIALPKVEDDKSNILVSRRDMSKYISYQVCFYIYCVLHAFLYFPSNFSILILGDGFMGSKIINDLATYGCGKFLKIFSRGEYSALEWRQKGFKSDFKLNKLIGSQPPDIIITCAENSTFSQICRQLVDEGAITENSILISATLGFQRKKLFNNLKIPTIFRTFTEPQEIVKIYRQKRKSLFKMDSILSEIQKTTELSTQSNENISLDDTNTLNDDQDITEIKSSADIVFRRTIDLKNILYLIENFYSMHGIDHSESRYLGLQTVFGFTKQRDELKNNDLVLNDPPLLKTDDSIRGKETKNEHSKVEFNLENETLGSLNNSEIEFQKENFNAEYDNFMRLKEITKTFRSKNKAVDEFCKNLEKTLKRMHNDIIQYFHEYFLTKISNIELQDLSRQHFTDHSKKNASPTRKNNQIKGSISEKVPPMYDESFIFKIFDFDDDYFNYSGDGIDFLISLDDNDKNSKKIEAYTTQDRAESPKEFNLSKMSQSSISVPEIVISNNESQR